MIDRRSFIASLGGILIPSVTFADETSGERTPRVLFFTARWCPVCAPAIDGDDGFRSYFAKSGWLIGSSVRDHIQIVDIDQRSDLADIYHVDQVPAVMLVDGTKRKAIPYRDRNTIIDLLRPQVAAKPHTVNVGVHSHKCRHCGFSWSHRDGDPGATHVCAKCGRTQTIIESHWMQAVEVAAPKPAGLPVFRSGGSGCPTCRRGAGHE